MTWLSRPLSSFRLFAPSTFPPISKGKIGKQKKNIRYTLKGCSALAPTQNPNGPYSPKILFAVPRGKDYYLETINLHDPNDQAAGQVRFI
jgi:hypothetical protein